MRAKKPPTVDPNNISDMELLQMFRQLNMKGKARVFGYIDTLFECGYKEVDPDTPNAEIISFADRKGARA